MKGSKKISCCPPKPAAPRPAQAQAGGPGRGDRTGKNLGDFLHPKKKGRK